MGVARVEVVPVLMDNYAYILIDQTTHEAAAVDPADPEKVVQVATRLGARITTVLTTHHHWDHSGGNKKLAEMIPNLRIYGWTGDSRRIPTLTHVLRDQDTINVGQLHVTALHTPCHTTGDLCYSVPGTPGCLFSGDTLFVAGCGRFLEGEACEMHTNLRRIAAMGLETRIFCGHEYTVSNLRFAALVEPGSGAIREKLEWAQRKQRFFEPTVPTTVEEELCTNPFLRIAAGCHGNDSAEQILALRELRQRKDSFSVDQHDTH